MSEVNFIHPGLSCLSIHSFDAGDPGQMINVAASQLEDCAFGSFSPAVNYITEYPQKHTVLNLKGGALIYPRNWN